jgi:hypothetical protein
MQRMKGNVLVVLAGLLALAMPPAMAETVTARIDNVNPYKPVDIVFNGHRETEWAGVMNWTRLGGSYAGLGGANSSNNVFSTFCIELTQSVWLGFTNTYTVADLILAPNTRPMGSPKSDLLRELWGRYRDSVINETTAAAFQVAVWDIVYDGDKSVVNGDFHLATPTNSIGTTAQGWLNTLNGTGPMPILGAMTDPSYQDQVFFISNSVPQDTPTVPLPASVWGGGAILMSLVVSRIRRMARCGQ